MGGILAGMSQKQMEYLEEREKKIRADLEKVKQRKREEERKEARQRRKKVDHAKYMVAGRTLEMARKDPKDPIWEWVNKTIADPNTRTHDRESLQALLEEYK